MKRKGDPKLATYLQLAIMAITMLGGLFFGWICVGIACGLPTNAITVTIAAVLAVASMSAWVVWFLKKD